MKKHYRKENDCLNCGTILQGKFCHNCGQENLEMKESFGHMMNHAISDYFHFDQQFFSTIKPLLFKPGFLTNEYLAGRRASYLHPIKMYIFISIVYFLLAFQIGHETVSTAKPGVKPFSVAKMLDSTKRASDSVNKAIDKGTGLNAAQKAALKKKIAQAQTISDYGLVTITDSTGAPNQWFNPTTKDTNYQQYITDQKKLPVAKQDGFFEKNYNKKVFYYNERYGSRAKEVFLEEFNHNIPKMMFLLLPLFALILRVAFWKSKKFYVEHLIYTFHLFCFLFLFLGIVILLQMILPVNWGLLGWINFLSAIYIMWYVYRSLRVVYHSSRFRTITKMIGVSLMYLLAFTFCISLLFFITAIII